MFLILALAALAAFELWSIIYKRSAALTPTAAISEPATTPSSSSSSSSSSIPSPIRSPSKPPSAPTTPAFAPPDEAALIEVDKVSLMIRDYHTLAGENPVGTNAEIMAAVMGGNPRQATLGPPEGMSLNEKGELIDRWGTPYFFHQLSRDQMEIRSAGPDKIMWTDDDPVTK